MIIIGVIAILAIFLCIKGILYFREINEELSFDTEAIDTIFVSMSNPEVHVYRAVDKEKITFHYHGRSLQDINLYPEINNRTLKITAKRKYIFFGTLDNTRLDIFIPEGYKPSFSVKTTSGTVHLDSIELTHFVLNTTSGGLKAATVIAEQINLNTTSGDLHFEKLNSDILRIKGTSSSINIGDCLVKNIEVELSSGNVAIAFEQLQGSDITVNTTSGTIILTLPDSAEFLVEARTTSGNFMSDFSIDKTDDSSKRKIIGQTGKADSQLILQSTSGHINVVKKDS